MRDAALDLLALLADLAPTAGFLTVPLADPLGGSGRRPVGTTQIGERDGNRPTRSSPRRRHEKVSA